MKRYSLFFDPRDRKLLDLIQEVRDGSRSPAYTRRLFYPHLHPNGIKEMVESKGLRIAYAAAHLLNSLEVGELDRRLTALQALHDEVILTAGGPMPNNTARVLLELMKALVRSDDDPASQLQLAHDFFRATSGKPRIIRKYLKRLHLYEMPEAGDQVAFDDHVHDASTKGRKSATHLLLDAWIKGIRRLCVIYYNNIRPDSALEVLEAARILKMDIQLGIEYPVRFYDRTAKLIWIPKDFVDAQDFLCFLAEPQVSAFMAQGKAISEFQEKDVYRAIAPFNESVRQQLGTDYGIDVAAVDEWQLRDFVGSGQASLLHLAKLIQEQMQPSLQKRLTQMHLEYKKAESRHRRRLREMAWAMHHLDAIKIKNDYLQPAITRKLDAVLEAKRQPQKPDLMQLSAPELIGRLNALPTAYRITLNLSDLTAADVLELLYDCQGAISQLELFNLKDFTGDQTEHLPAIDQLQRAINDGSYVALKRTVDEIIAHLDSQQAPDSKCRRRKLKAILHDVANLKLFYSNRPLTACIGSDSTGQSPRFYGMGLVACESLPPSARKIVFRGRNGPRMRLPVHLPVYRRTIRRPKTSVTPAARKWMRWLRKVPLVRSLAYESHSDWQVREDLIRLGPGGNLIALGGIKTPRPDVNRWPQSPPAVALVRSWFHLNTGMKNALKVLVGFVPAFATFALTKQWWLLAYGGAFIWFGITGLRNVLQSVLGGGGLRRSPLMQWTRFVNWDRVCDSLLFTGFSVPLLDYVVKTVVLERLCGITTTSNPLALYAWMGLANGIYLSSHNFLRGLPRAAVIGNFFRSILSIPVAIGLNALLAVALGAVGVAAPQPVLQKWAAVISKTASDFMAGIIEGLADRATNIRLRVRDYKYKLAQLMTTYEKLALLFSEEQVMQGVNAPEKVAWSPHSEARDLLTVIRINALDLLYFWMYQPRGRSGLRWVLASLSAEERRIFFELQCVLRHERSISQMFIDGMVGPDFSGPLAFYLSRYREYLSAVEKMGQGGGAPPQK